MSKDATNPIARIPSCWGDVPNLWGPAPLLCDDCHGPTDMGRKCRACYKQWSRLLWQDIPRELDRLQRVCKDLRSFPIDTRKRIAALLLGKPLQGTLQGRDADMAAIVKGVIAGPFKDSMEATLVGCWNESSEKAPAVRRSEFK